jgi:D-alanyl-D-alanine carboxypeptidase
MRTIPWLASARCLDFRVSRKCSSSLPKALETSTVGRSTDERFPAPYIETLGSDHFLGCGRRLTGLLGFRHQSGIYFKSDAAHELARPDSCQSFPILEPACERAENKISTDPATKRCDRGRSLMPLNWLRFTRQCLAGVFFTSAICFAQMQFPDTPAGHQAAAWLQAFNSGDREKLHDFLEKNLPDRAQHMDQAMGFRTMTGGFDLKKVEESTPTKLTALVQERNSDQMARLTIEVDPAESHRLTNLDLRGVPRPPEFALPHLSESELIAVLRKKLDEDSAADRFFGTVLIAKTGKPIFVQAYGFADREHKVSNNVKTRFRIGSMNKMFTATSTLQLAEGGKLGLDDSVGKYLTDYPNQDIATKVTIRQLLTHTGGTGDIFGPDFEKHRLELRTLQDYIKLYGNRSPQFDPGSRWEYSNYGFILLGAIVEKVSGQSYYDYVREHVYAPSGMTSSGSEPEEVTVPDRSIGYTRMDGPELRPNTDTLPYRGTSAGGGYSTVEDLLKFANALEDHKLLNAEFTDMLTTGKVEARGARYAFGFEDQMINGVRCFGHGGGAPGMNGDLEICPGPGYVVAVLANTDPPAASHVSNFITGRLPEH